MLKHLNAMRYVSPLREGGSMPAIVEGDDNRLYVLKFRGAGQGRKALIAELIAGEVGRLLGLNVPEIVLMEMDPVMGQHEIDPEIQDLLRFSAGLNLAMAYLPSALMFAPRVSPPPDALLASQIVWFDAYVMNVDRTPRNSNLLLWNKQFWLIDHGAALYFHHAWLNYQTRGRDPFKLIKDHVLLPMASELSVVDAESVQQLNAENLRAIVDSIPDDWLIGESLFETAAQVRDVYYNFLVDRLNEPRVFVEEALNARTALV
jgi:hypothetical protein